MRLLEIIAPRKPEKVTTKLSSTYGVQGSTFKVSDRSFVTKKNNVVRVRFTPENDWSGKRSVDITFYVNDTLDDRSYADKDPEILPGVLHVILQFLKRSKVDQCTFIAASGDGDYKKVYNLPKEKIVKAVTMSANKLKTRLENTIITPEMEKEYLDKRNEMLSVVGRPLVDKITYIYKDELISMLSRLMSDIENISTAADANEYVTFLKSHSNNIGRWPEYDELTSVLHKFVEILLSYRDIGLTRMHNRRLSIYTKMVDYYFAKDWDIDIYGTKFTLTRKEKK